MSTVYRASANTMGSLPGECRVPGKPVDFYREAINLTNLVEYQDGAVVSKTVLDKTIGNITVFAFAQGQGLSEHTSPYDAFVHIFDGERRPLP